MMPLLDISVNEIYFTFLLEHCLTPQTLTEGALSPVHPCGLNCLVPQVALVLKHVRTVLLRRKLFKCVSGWFTKQTKENPNSSDVHQNVRQKLVAEMKAENIRKFLR